MPARSKPTKLAGMATQMRGQPALAKVLTTFEASAKQIDDQLRCAWAKESSQLVSCEGLVRRA